jgi:hypothetical protein
MAQRINALVHGGMSAEDAAEVIGIDPSVLVQHGNGFAIIELPDDVTNEVAEAGLDEAEEEAEEDEGE